MHDTGRISLTMKFTDLRKRQKTFDFKSSFRSVRTHRKWLGGVPQRRGGWARRPNAPFYTFSFFGLGAPHSVQCRVSLYCIVSHSFKHHALSFLQASLFFRSLTWVHLSSELSCHVCRSTAVGSSREGMKSSTCFLMPGAAPASGQFPHLVSEHEAWHPLAFSSSFSFNRREFEPILCFAEPSISSRS